MIIKIVPKEGSDDTLTLLINDEPWRDIHAKLFGRKPKFATYPTLEEFENAFSDLEYQRAKVYAIRRLSFKSQNSSELREALKSRLVSQGNIHRIIQEFVEQGYLNDEEWAKSFIRLQLAKKVGIKVIRMKLHHKGISPSLIEKSLKECDHNPEEQIQKLLQSRYKNRNLKDYREKQKVIAALVRKGYELSEIIPIITSQPL